MSLISDGFTTSQRASRNDSEGGSLRKLVESIARGMGPNSLVVSRTVTASVAKRWARLTAAAAFRIKGDNNTGTALTFRRYGSNDADVAASYTTVLAGANNDLVYTAKELGAVGNGVTIRYVDPAGNNQVLAVVVTGQAIVVNLATGAGGAITSTSALIKAAIEASEPANALVSVAHSGADTGAGVVIALAATNLANGADTAVPTIAVASGAAIDLPCVSNANEWSVKRSDDSATPVTLQALVHNTV